MTSAPPKTHFKSWDGGPICKSGTRKMTIGPCSFDPLKVDCRACKKHPSFLMAHGIARKWS